MSDAKVQIYGMVHSQNVLGPLMIATHYKLGELAFTNLFEDRTPEFKAMNPFNKCPVLKDGDFVIAESSACLRWSASRRTSTPSSPKCRARR
jgi:glutathione S-transferase